MNRPWAMDPAEMERALREHRKLAQIRRLIYLSICLRREPNQR